MKTHTWENKEYIYKQTIDENGHIVDVVRIPKFDIFVDKQLTEKVITIKDDRE